MDEETGSELDFTSSEFDALQALTSPNVSVPIPEAPTFNNLGQLISTMARVKAKQAQGDVSWQIFYRFLVYFIVLTIMF